MRPSATGSAAFEALERRQAVLAVAAPPVWSAEPGRPLRVGAVFAAGPRDVVGEGAAGDPAWAAAVVMEGRRVVARAVVNGEFGAPYHSGHLWLRQGPIVLAAARDLWMSPDVMLVDGTGRDHPRRAGLAIQLGAELDLPTIGVTDRPLLAAGPEPALTRGLRTELRLDGELVGYRLRTRSGARPLCVHPAWRTRPEAAADIVLTLCWSGRTPEPLREARHLARTARSMMARG